MTNYILKHSTFMSLQKEINFSVIFNQTNEFHKLHSSSLNLFFFLVQIEKRYTAIAKVQLNLGTEGDWIEQGSEDQGAEKLP